MASETRSRGHNGPCLNDAGPCRPRLPWGGLFYPAEAEICQFPAAPEAIGYFKSISSDGRVRCCSTAHAARVRARERGERKPLSRTASFHMTAPVCGSWALAASHWDYNSPVTQFEEAWRPLPVETRGGENQRWRGRSLSALRGVVVELGQTAASGTPKSWRGRA